LKYVGTWPLFADDIVEVLRLDLYSWSSEGVLQYPTFLKNEKKNVE